MSTPVRRQTDTNVLHAAAAAAASAAAVAAAAAAASARTLFDCSH